VDPLVPPPDEIAHLYQARAIRRAIRRSRVKSRGGPRVTPLLPTAALLTYTGPADPDAGDWTTGLSMSPCVKGNGWERYKASVLATPGVEPTDIVETTSSGYQMIAFNGTSAIPFMKLFDLVMLQHAPSVDLLAILKAAKVKTGLCYFNYESIGQVVPYNPWFNDINDVSMTHLFSSSELNVNGCANVDQFEALGEGAPCGTQSALEGAGTGHTWLCDASDSEYADAWGTQVATSVLGRYPTSLDYILIDNLLNTPYAGVASNFISAEYPAASYVAGQKVMLATVEAGLPGIGVMGNSRLEYDDYSATELSHRYSEHFFHSAHTSSNTTAQTLAHIQSDLALAGGTRILGSQIVSTGANYTSGTMAATHVDRFGRYEAGPSGASWGSIRDAAVSTESIERTYILAARSSGSAKFPLFTNSCLHWRG